MPSKRKYKCKYCDSLISVNGGLCSTCQEKLVLVRKLLRMVKTAAQKEGRNYGKS